MQKFEKHIDIKYDNASNAVDILSKFTNLSKQVIKDTMAKGAVWITRGNQTQRLRRAKKKLQNGDTLHIYFNPDILAEEPSGAELLIDEIDYSIWYKPSGMYCQGSKWGDHHTINRWAEKQLDRPTFIVHRLDKTAKGLIVLTHSKQATQSIAKLFEERKVDKRYQAVIDNQFEAEKTINLPIDGKEAITHLKLAHYSKPNNKSLIDITIETGRKHQIRKHLAAINSPIIGDRLYGNEKEIPENLPDLQLCSIFLSFENPINGERKTYTLPNKHLLVCD